MSDTRKVLLKRRLNNTTCPKESDMSEGEGRAANESHKVDASSSASVLRARELFRGSREIWIEHEGKYYRLRITRRNKLILQK